MDFSSLNPLSSNSLNLAARNNDVEKVKKLLKKINPNCVDNRGWTCLHEAAAKDSYDCLLLILKNRNTRLTAETHEGHTALYLACKFMSSIQTIQALLDSKPNIVNYGSNENVTPLHVASSQGRVEVIQLLIDYGAMINVQDFDGDTPLHDAVLNMKLDSIDILLHAGADAQIKNKSKYTPFHIACFKGCEQIVQSIFPFVTDINETNINGDTSLKLAAQESNDSIVKFLLRNGADPHKRNDDGEIALTRALTMGNSSTFEILLSATSPSEIDRNIILYACKPHIFQMPVLECLLKHKSLGSEFFDFFEPFHITLEKFGDFKPTYFNNAPFNSYLNICEYIYNRSQDKFREFIFLFLMRGLSVNAIDVSECPPLVYLHFCMHTNCFNDVFKIFREHGCNVDYCSVFQLLCSNGQRYIPDAMLASISSDPTTLLLMIPHSLYCDPEFLLRFLVANKLLQRIPQHVQQNLLSMIDNSNASLTANTLACTVLPLKHLCRQSFRSSLRYITKNWLTTDEFYTILNRLYLPVILKRYLCFDPD